MKRNLTITVLDEDFSLIGWRARTDAVIAVPCASFIDRVDLLTSWLYDGSIGLETLPASQAEKDYPEHGCRSLRVIMRHLTPLLHRNELKRRHLNRQMFLLKHPGLDRPDSLVQLST